MERDYFLEGFNMDDTPIQMSKGLDKPITWDCISKMTADEINANWDAVKKVMEKGKP